MKYYEGGFLKGLRHGECTFIDFDGSKFRKEMRNDLKDGKGCLQFPNGNHYEGDFVNDQKVGFGKLSYQNKNYY